MHIPLILILLIILFCGCGALQAFTHKTFPWEWIIALLLGFGLWVEIKPK